MDALRSAYLVVPYIDEQVCQACPKCQARQACRSKAITLYDRGEPPFIDGSRCYGCRACIPACPFGAVAVNA